MKSPFPGMDPYLEARWSDVRVSLIVFLSESIQLALPRDLRARINQRIRDDFDPVAKDRWIEIIDITDRGRVVTQIELFNPRRHELGALNDAIAERIRRAIRECKSIVAIDLVRSGRMPDVPNPNAIGLWYSTSEARYWRPIRLREPLPEVTIPLRAHDNVMSVGLQPIVDRAYLAGRHDDIDYSRPTDPPLAHDDAEWADRLLASAGKR
jgi:hypothetical protein